MSAEAVLDARRRCLLAFNGPRGPMVAPMAYWSDGGHAWMSTSASTVKVDRLRRDGTCALYVRGQDGTGVRVRGSARVFSAADPLGLAIHGPAITAAMTVLAASNLGSIGGYVQDAARVPARYLPHNRVVVRVRLDDVATVVEPERPPGVAPALPPVVPPDVRRVLAGERHLVLAVGGPQLEVIPAVWSAGFALRLPADRRVAPGTRVAAVLDDDPQGRPTEVVGLSLRGEVGADGRLAPDRATWWQGFDLGSADVPPASAGTSGIVLPD